MPKLLLSALATAALVAAACGGQAREPSLSIPVSPTGPDGAGAPGGEPGRVDPREGGLEVGFGEFAIAMEAEEIRPGPVTFVVRNRGELVHGFELKAEDGPARDAAGERFQIERPPLDPGETIRISTRLLPGVYELECYVADHDERGMETRLVVSEDAPLVAVTEAAPGRVGIEGFAFHPEGTEVPAGTEVTWRNEDAAEHTVTADDGTFGSDPLGRGQSFSFTFDRAGEYAYFCAIHPAMRGTIRVTG